MVQLPFSAAAAAVLIGAVIAGGAIGVMTSPPAEAPPVQASAAPTPAPVALSPSEPAAETPSPPPQIEQAVIEVAPPPTPAPLQPENVVQQTETTTIVAAPVIVTSLGVASGCVGCIEHRHDDKARRPVTRIEHPAARREVVPPRVVFVRPAHVAAASAHRR